MTHSKKTALVTGGSRGIGAAVCVRLAQDGFHVAINYASNEAKAQEVMNRILHTGGSAEILGFDVSNAEQVDEKIASLVAKTGGLAVLVNNAGITIDGLLLRLKDADLEKTLDIDLKGAIYCTRAAAKHMIKGRTEGSLIQISSVVGEMGNPGQAAYSAAKAGLIGFSKSVARELGSRLIRCNVITPGYISTDMTGALTDAQKEAILRNVPLGTLGTPEDIASVVSFLASQQSRYITGQVIGVNGGMYM